MSDEQVDRADIIEDSPTALQPLALNLDAIVKLEAAADLYQNRYLPVCMKMTQPSDWVSHGRGRFSLQCSGAEKLANPLGISWDKPDVIKHMRTDDKGEFYEYEVTGIVECKALGRQGWFTGNTDSRDQFFTARPSGFDEGDIRKSAFSNWLVNGITRLAGIRNPTPELFAKAGLDVSKIPGISYSGNTSESAGQGLVTEAQRKRFYAKTQSSGIPEDVLKQHMKDTWGYSSSKEIKKKDYDAVCEWADKWKEES